MIVISILCILFNQTKSENTTKPINDSSGGYNSAPDVDKNSIANLKSTPFSLPNYKSGTTTPKTTSHIISYGSYYPNTSNFSNHNFSNIHNIAADLEKGVAQIDSSCEISTTKGLLHDQLSIIKEDIIVNPVEDNFKNTWRNIYTPSGFNIKDNSNDQINISYYSKDSDDVSNVDNDSILCSISFNFNFIPITASTDSDYIVAEQNQCLSIDAINEIDTQTFVNNTPKLSDTVGTSYSIGYSFKNCNTYINNQKFVVRRYSWDKKNNIFIIDRNGLYTSITHKSINNFNYYLTWDIDTGKFIIKNFDPSSNDEIIWLFYPEVTITEANIVSKTWCNYNNWYQHDKLVQLGKIISGEKAPKLLNYGDFNYEITSSNKINSGTFLEQKAKYYAAHIVDSWIDGYRQSIENDVNIVYNAGLLVYDTYKIISNAIEQALDLDKMEFYQLKLPVAAGDIIAAEEYVTSSYKTRQTSDTNNSTWNNYINEINNIDKGVCLYGDMFNNMVSNGVKVSPFLYEENPSNSGAVIKEYYPCSLYTLNYPEFIYTANTSGYVGEKGFTMTTLGDRYSQEHKTDYIGLLDSHLDTSNAFFSDNTVKWIRSDPYENTYTFSNSYFYGMKGTSGIKTLSYSDMIISPFVEGMSITNLEKYLVIKDGILTLTPSDTEALGNKNLPEGSYVFGTSYILTNNGGSLAEINIELNDSYVNQYSINYPGNGYKIDDDINVIFNPSITTDKMTSYNSIQFKVGTSIPTEYPPIFDVTIEGDTNLQGHDFMIKSSSLGVSLLSFDTITDFIKNPKDVTKHIQIDYGGAGYTTNNKVIISATNQLNSLIKVAYVFNVTEITDDVSVQDSKKENIKNLYSSNHLFSTDKTRLPKLNYYHNKVVFDLTDRNTYLKNNPMISPSQIGFAGVSVMKNAEDYFSSGVSEGTSINTLRDIFTLFDQGDSKTTLTSLLTLQKQVKENISISTPLKESIYSNAYIKSHDSINTTISTDTEMDFLNSLQFQNLNYGNKSSKLGNDTNLDVSKETLILSTWIPYKKMRLIDTDKSTTFMGNGLYKFTNPGPGLKIPTQNIGTLDDILGTESSPLISYSTNDLYNYNSASIIPYGIDNIYEKVFSQDEIPTF